MSYERERYEEHPMRQVGRYIRQYFDDVRRDGGREREYGSREYDRPEQRYMRFDNHQSYGAERQYGSQEEGHGFHRHMEQYWHDVKEDMERGRGEKSRGMLGAMAMVAAEAVRCCMEAKERGGKHGGEHDSHYKLNKAVEKLRRAPLQDRSKMMREMFPNLQGREQRVLQDMVSMESTEARARRLSMSKKEYTEATLELARILQEDDDEDEKEDD